MTFFRFSNVRKLTIFIIIFSFVPFIFFHKLVFRLSENENFKDEESTILWWTPFAHRNKSVICGAKKCFITENRSYANRSNTKAILFYGSNFSVSDLPLPRRAALWALLHEESPRNIPPFLSDDLLSTFNISSTFSRYSHFPLTTLHLPNSGDILDAKYLVPLKEKNKLLSELAPVLYIQSDCSTPIDRDSYVNELMKHISVDSYGLCLGNREFPDNLKTIESLEKDEFYKFVSRYKFALAIENSVCGDYITEKLWRPLMVGSVPIYYGSPTVSDWLPDGNSAILISDFPSPVDLAARIRLVNENDTLYESYLAFKVHGIRNQLLRRALDDRNWNSNGLNFVEAFECFVCNLHQRREYTVNRTHYDCSKPLSMITGVRNESNWWHEAYRIGKCEGNYIARFAESNSGNLKMRALHDKVTEMIKEGKC